jgi:hypothetical protein
MRIGKYFNIGKKYREMESLVRVALDKTGNASSAEKLISYFVTNRTLGRPPRISLMSEMIKISPEIGNMVDAGETTLFIKATNQVINQKISEALGCQVRIGWPSLKVEINSFPIFY